MPPVVPSIKTVDEPEQTLAVPVIDDGKGLTVTVAVVVHPPEAVYVIRVVPPVPVAPVTIPLVKPIVAAVVLPLLHVPPVVASIKVADEPGHIANTPVMPGGSGFINTIVATAQPAGEV